LHEVYLPPNRSSLFEGGPSAMTATRAAHPLRIRPIRVLLADSRRGLIE
jgi:hypothetical protein